MLLRYISLLLLTGVVGVASGFLWLIPNGIMGGVLGTCLSAGTIWLGIKQRRQEGNLTLRQVLGTGFVSGLLAGILMAGVSQARTNVRRGEFGPPRLPFWVLLIMGILYGIAIHWSYYRRRFSSKPLRQALAYACVTCLLVKIAGTCISSITTERSRDIHAIVTEAGVLFLLGTAPFVLLWINVTASLDPAWSHPSWKRGEDKQTPITPND